MRKMAAARLADGCVRELTSRVNAEAADERARRGRFQKTIKTAEAKVRTEGATAAIAEAEGLATEEGRQKGRAPSFRTGDRAN